MNKQKFKWNLFLLSISLFFFISCLNEDTITEIETGKKIKIGYVDYANVQHLKPNVENFKSKHQNLRTNSFENLDLDLTRILQYFNTETGYKSYSIVINKTIPENTPYYFENLHFTEYSEQVFDEYICRWIPDNPNIPFELSTFTGIVEKYDLNYNIITGNYLVNGISQSNSNRNSLKSGIDNPPAEYPITCVLVIDCTPEECDCYDSWDCSFWYHCSGGGGGSGSGGDGAGGDGGLGGDGGSGGGGSGSDSGTGSNNDTNNGDPLHGDPVVPLDPLAVTTTPCNELKKLTQQPAANSPNIPLPNKKTRDAILQMQNEISYNAEAGYEFLNIPAGNYAKHIPPASNDPNHVYFPKNNSYCYGGIHTHPSDINQWTQMFSHDDLYMLIETQSSYTGPNTSGNDLFVNIMTIKIGGNNYTYAVKISDINKLTNKLNGLHPNANGSKKKWNTYGNKLLGYYADSNGYPLNNITDYEKAFLQFVKDEDLGVSLYEMKQNANNSDPTWNKLELNGNNTPNRIPCN